MDPIVLQKQVRDNSEELRSYLKDLSTWEDEMKRKESSINDKKVEHETPVVRSKIKKVEGKKAKDKKPVQKIKGYDYRAWDKFDVEAECEKIDTEKTIETGTESSDSEEYDPSDEYQMRLRDEATYEKERGNQFVKQQKWNEAISCYTHAIACYPKDPIYYANRALCYLKKNDLPSAEADCTSALQFDPNYVKALQRRAAARSGLKQFKEAVADLKKVLELEPNNKESKKELDKLEKHVGTNKKETTNSTEPTIKYVPPVSEQSKNKKDEKKQETVLKYVPPKDHPETEKKVQKEEPTPEIKVPWPPRPNAKPIKTVQKLPHLRSKTPLHTVRIKEVDIERKIPDIDKPSGSGLQKNLSEKNNTDKKVLVEDLGHLHTEKNVDSKTEVKKINTVNEPQKTEQFDFPVPKSSVQFMSNWKMIKHNKDQKLLYLKQINPIEIPNIFQEAMESDTFGDILNILSEKFIDQNLDVFSYLKYLSNVKRFSTLTLFMSSADKTALKKLFEYCKNKNVPQEEIDSLRKKYEI